MKQQCNLAMVWLTWIGLPVLSVLIGLKLGWLAGIFILVIGIFAQIYYIKLFPKISRWMGYGTVDDTSAESTPDMKIESKVILYTANVCPFCPIVKQRLIELQKFLDFKLDEVDITFKPSVVKEKGFKSVPVIEKNGKFWFGNATSSELLSFLTK